MSNGQLWVLVGAVVGIVGSFVIDHQPRQPRFKSRFDRPGAAVEARLTAVEAKLEHREARIDNLDRRLESRIQGIESRVQGVEAKFEARFTALEVRTGTRLQGVETKIDNLDQRVQSRIQRLETRVQGIESQLVGVRGDVARVEGRLDGHLAVRART